MNEKMNHDFAPEELSSYLEGDLEPDRKNALEKHLQQCPTCRRQLDLLHRSLELMRKLPSPRAPAEFAHRLKTLARRRGIIGRRKNQPVPRWLISFESALLLFLVTAGSVLLLLYFVELSPRLETKPYSASLTLAGKQYFAPLIQAAQDCRAKFLCGNRLCPVQELSPETLSLAIMLDAQRLDCLREKLSALGLTEALKTEKLPEKGLLIIPVTFSHSGESPRAPKEPASAPDQR